MNEFVHGALTACYLVIALFFLRFWRRSSDRLFLWFAIAFAILAVNRFSVSARQLTDEVGSSFYWIRLAAYLVILAAILDKNLRHPRGVPGP
jgi:hypothetical protein